MRRTATLVVALLALGAQARSQEAPHVLTPEKLKEVLASPRAQRQEDLALVDGLLSGEKARRVAGRTGQDLGRIREALPSLSDAELHDLAVRASRLQTDPTAGLTHDVEELLIIFLIVGLVIIIIKSA